MHPNPFGDNLSPPHNPFAAPPSAGAMPPTRTAAAARPVLIRPVTVVVAVVMFVVTAALVVAQVVSESLSHDAQTAGIVIAAILGIAFVACYLTFAWFSWQGQVWPRHGAVALAVLSLFGLLGGPIVIAIVVCGVIATVLLWLPPSRRYTTPYTPPAPDPFRA